jgi:hypothetical protein
VAPQRVIRTVQMQIHGFTAERNRGNQFNLGFVLRAF